MTAPLRILLAGIGAVSLLWWGRLLLYGPWAHIPWAILPIGAGMTVGLAALFHKVPRRLG